MSQSATVVARSGSRYVLDLGEGQGQIADTGAGILLPTAGAGSITAHMPYLEPVEGIDAEDILTLCRRDP